MNRALVLIDFQNAWQDKDSEDYIGDLSGLIKKTNNLIEFARKQKYKIIWTRHIEKDSDYNFKDETWNSEIISDLHFENNDVVVKKNKVSPFLKTNMDKELKGVEEVVVCGILTNLCVRSFIEGAYDRDFEITVVKDCCMSFDEEMHNFTFEDLKATREEIEFIDLDEFVERN